MNKKILVVSAVEAELSPFLMENGLLLDRWNEWGGRQVWCSCTGVGPVASAYRIQKLITELKPDRIIQAGMAGCYAHSGLEVGQTVVVTKERLADLGAMIEGRFTDIFPEEGPLINPGRFPDFGFPEVPGFTVSTGCPVHVDQILEAYKSDSPAVETMEGYALFYVCLSEGVPFLELRTVSNLVSQDRSSWNIPLAAQNLAAALAGVLGKL